MRENNKVGFTNPTLLFSTKKQQIVASTFTFALYKVVWTFVKKYKK